MVCDRYIEVGKFAHFYPRYHLRFVRISWLHQMKIVHLSNRSGAIVSSINPSLSMTSACLEVAELQQQLLWLLYDMNHLKRYPMAIGCLGEHIETLHQTIYVLI